MSFYLCLRCNQSVTRVETAALGKVYRNTYAYTYANRAGETLTVCAASGPRPILTLRDASGNSLSYGVEGAVEIFPVTAVADKESGG